MQLFTDLNQINIKLLKLQIKQINILFSWNNPRQVSIRVEQILSILFSNFQK